MARNGQRQGSIITCTSSQRKSPWQPSVIRLSARSGFDSAKTLVVRQKESGFSFSPPTHQGVGEEYSSLSLQSSMGSRQPRLGVRTY